MAITPTKKARTQARITKWEAYLETLESMYANFDDVESYAFDSGEGRQQTKYRSISDLTREMSRVESIIERLYRILQGTAVVNLNLRRM